VIWLNDGPSPHTATSNNDVFDTGTLQVGKLKSKSFKEAGTYHYSCSIHPQMKGPSR
jgi:plastocyanin